MAVECGGWDGSRPRLWSIDGVSPDDIRIPHYVRSSPMTAFATRLAASVAAGAAAVLCLTGAATASAQSPAAAAAACTGAELQPRLAMATYPLRRLPQSALPDRPSSCSIQTS